MRAISSFIAVFSSGALTSLYLVLPVIRVNLGYTAEPEAYVVRNSALLSSIPSGIMLVLMWTFDSSLASLLGRRLRRGVRVKLIEVMNELVLAYLPTLILLLFLIPYTWLNLPNLTAEDLGEYLYLVKGLEESGIYSSGILAILFSSLASSAIYPLVFRYRLGFRWNHAAVLSFVVLLSNTLILLWVLSVSGWNELA